MTSTKNRAPFLYYIKQCASFQSHQWIQTGVTVWKCPIRVKISNFLSRVTLKFDRWHWKTIGHLFYATARFLHHFTAICEIWQMTLKNIRPPLLTYFKLCPSFRSHMWIQTRVTVWKRLNWVWLWPLTSEFGLLHGHHFLSMVITSENFMKTRWQEHSEKGGQIDRRTEGQTDRQTRQTERGVLRDAWSQLKKIGM